jgi:hypothetical protein
MSQRTAKRCICFLLKYLPWISDSQTIAFEWQEIQVEHAPLHAPDHIYHNPQQLAAFSITNPNTTPSSRFSGNLPEEHIANKKALELRVEKRMSPA